jgi:hypothetical protein
VLVDVSLAWRLLKDGGFMLLDDYGLFNPALDRTGEEGGTGEGEGGGALAPPPPSSSSCGKAVREGRELSCGGAIDAVLASVPGGAEVLHCGANLLVRKRRGAFDAGGGVQAVPLAPGAQGWAADTAATLEYFSELSKAFGRGTRAQPE